MCGNSIIFTFLLILSPLNIPLLREKQQLKGNTFPVGRAHQRKLKKDTLYVTLPRMRHFRTTVFGKIVGYQSKPICLFSTLCYYKLEMAGDTVPKQCSTVCSPGGILLTPMMISPTVNLEFPSSQASWHTCKERPSLKLISENFCARLSRLG